jgi:hypothetical protein
MDVSKNRSPVLLLGVLVGAILGGITAQLYARSVDENQRAGNMPAPVQTGDLFRIGLALFALVRQVSDLGAKKK